MADALLSAFIDQLASAITEIATHEVGLIKGAGEAIESLKKNLGAIKVVLKDAEKRQWAEDDVKIWVDELKDVSYDMDQVLDEWNTAILRSEIINEEGTTGEIASLGSKLKVRISALCRCFHSGPLGRVVHRRAIASKIENLNSRLDRISTRKDMFSFSSTSARIDNPIRSNTTTSFVDVSKVFGQDTYRENLIDRLLSEDGQNRGNLQIIPVVGMGGIGKTTLAKVVFNDDEVKGHFGKRLWVCVSDPFDIVKIANAIIQQLTGEAPPSGELEVLMQSLTASIQDKKFLLVLDDVWTDDYQKWEPLERHLLCGDAESRVIVTTRKVEVVRMMGVRESSMIRVKELSETDSWSLFSEIAFFGRPEEEKEELEEIGMKITLKCNGLPLALKTLGSLLRIKRTKEEWFDVLQSEIWRLEKVKEKVFYPLLLSYFDLSPTEKRCLAYCAIFPKDQKLDKMNLILMWMAQGYFDGFVTGERCFENLAMRSFFQDFRYLWDGYFNSCKMHDIVHDFVLFLTTNEHFYLVLNNLKKKFTLNTRHFLVLVPLEHQSRPSHLLSISSSKNLQSLVLLSPRIVGKSAIDWCLRFASLRVFIVVGKINANLECIGDLVHLRYLELHCVENDGVELREFPRTLGNLCNMQSLSLTGFSLPKEVAKLINLMHLDCSYGDHSKFISLPKGISRLKNLRNMSVTLCSSRDANVGEKFELGDLSHLNHLRILMLQNVGIDEGHVEGARRAQLFRGTNLLQLVLFFGEGDRSCVEDYETHENTLEALQPPQSLTFLRICQYGARVMSPGWMSSSSSLTHLKLLCFEDFSSCETLPPLGKLRSLETLLIINMARVKKLGPEFLGHEECKNNAVSCSSNSRIPTAVLFPKLKTLYFRSMASWREWVGIQGWNNKGNAGLKIMPCLEKLEFYTCEELEALPEFLETTPLLELIVAHSPKLQSACREEIGKEWSKIQHAPNITFFV